MTGNAITIRIRTKLVLLVVPALLAGLMVSNSWAATGNGVEQANGNAAKKLNYGAYAPKTAYHHPYNNGFYSTVTSMNLVGYAPKIKEQDEFKLKKIPGFHKDFKVEAVMHKSKAPLAVVLLGFDGKTDFPYARRVIYCLAFSGYHVMTFKASFTPEFIEKSRHGVSANVTKETDQIVSLIGEFIKHKDVAGKVGPVGVVGLSYGGIQALQIAVRSKEGKLPFKLDGCLALSPPIKLKTTAILLDKFYKKDRWKTTMAELAKKFGGHEPVVDDTKIPFTDSEMRGAIAFVFRSELKNVVLKNDKYYKLKKLPGSGREDYAQAWGFGKFIVDMSVPYWEQKGAVKSESDFWAPTELKNILPKLPDNAACVLTANDPLNSESDLTEITGSYEGKNLVILPKGGHLGYLGTRWARIKLGRVCKSVAPAANGVKDK